MFEKADLVAAVLDRECLFYNRSTKIRDYRAEDRVTEQALEIHRLYRETHNDRGEKL